MPYSACHPIRILANSPELNGIASSSPGQLPYAAHFDTKPFTKNASDRPDDNHAARFAQIHTDFGVASERDIRTTGPRKAGGAGSFSGRIVVHLDRAHEPAASRSTLGWLETSIRSYAKSVDVASKLPSSETDEQVQHRRERMAV